MYAVLKCIICIVQCAYMYCILRFLRQGHMQAHNDCIHIYTLVVVYMYMLDWYALLLMRVAYVLDVGVCVALLFLWRS